MLHVSVQQRLDGRLFDELVAHGDQHVAGESDVPQGLGGDLCGVPGPQLGLLIDVHDPLVCLDDGIEHLLGLRAHHQQEAVESHLLEDAYLSIDSGHGVDFKVDFEAHLAQVGSSHPGSLARGEDNHHGSLGNGLVAGHLPIARRRLGGSRWPSAFAGPSYHDNPRACGLKVILASKTGGDCHFGGLTSRMSGECKS